MKSLLFATFIALFLAAITQTACYYDNEKDLYGTEACDTTTVSFSGDIKPIVDANCVRCHAPGGEQEVSPLLTYEDVKKYVSGNVIVDRTTGTTTLMPPEGKMNNCNLLLIQAWVNAGAPNN